MNRRKQAALIFGILAAAWIGVLFYFSGQSGAESGSLSLKLAKKLLEWLPMIDMPLDEFCQKLFGLGVEAVILTLGKDGCRLITKEDDIYIPTYKVKVADTTGCGDTFNSTFLASVLTGKSLPEAAKYANAAANMAATVLGPRGGITTFDKVDKFIEDQER